MARRTELPMGRKKKPQPSERIRVHEDVARMIAVYASAKGVDAVDWFSDLVRPTLQELMPEVWQSIAPDAKKPPRKPTDK